ncbi:MAG: M67 family metallopeptidase [Nitrospirota bacterium]
MDRLIIPRHIFDGMVAHCRAGLPDEACGILAGTGSEVAVLYTMTNADPSPVSYLMEPGEQLTAFRDMREKGMQMLAVFHSHPQSPAYPSAKDQSLAFYEDSLYVIVGLAEGEPVVKAFSLRGGEVAETPLVVR